MTSTSTTTSGRVADEVGHSGRPRADHVDAGNRLVGFALDLVDAPDGAVGLLTSGSGEAALLAVLAAREARPEVHRPALVVTDTADPAFTRAAHLLGVEVVVVESDPTSRAPIGPVAHAMDERTVLAVVSAPSATLGVIDPVTWIGTAGAAKGVPLHVDARAGGWLLAFGERLGRVVPAWTFAAPGVGSVSLDLPAGGTASSLLLFRSRDVRRTLTSASATGPGLPLVNDTGVTDGIATTAWQVVRGIGEDGYLRRAGATLRCVDALVSGVVAIPGLHLAHVPDAAVVVLRTDDTCDVFTVAEALRSRGWRVEAQPSWRLLPPTLRLEVDAHTDVDALLTALEIATRTARAHGPGVLPTRLLDHLARLDATRLTTEDVALLLGSLGLDPTAAPHSARYGLLLDAAPARLREALAARLHELVHTPVRG